MTSSSELRTPTAAVWRRRVLWIAAAWLALGALHVEQSRLLYDLMMRPAPYLELWWVAFRRAVLWTGLTVFLFWLRDRRYLWPSRWPGIVVVHVVLAFLFAAFVTSADIAIGRWSGIQSWSIGWAPVFLRLVNRNLFNYMAAAVVMHGLEYYRAAREREVRTAQLEREVAKARLDLVTMHLQPHFLFNTLHAIASFVHGAPDRAERMIIRLGDLLRASMREAGKPLLPIEREIENIRAYLDIQAARFGDRLRADIHVEEGLEDAHIPVLLLQPLVENAVKHGIGDSPDGGSIAITVRGADDRIIVTVEDSGSGRPATFGPDGLGVQLTRARLLRAYGASATLSFRTRPAGGVAAVMTLPYHPVTSEFPAMAVEVNGRA